MLWGFGAFGVILFGYGLYLHYKSLRSMSWPVVEGQIVDSKVVTLPNDPSGAKISVTFGYEVGGVPYKSNQFRFGAVGQATSIEAAKRVVGKYPTGATVPVSYDPNDPTDAVLEPGDGDYGYLFCILGLLVPLIALICTRFPRITMLYHFHFPR
jgi:hypothetical protein